VIITNATPPPVVGGGTGSFGTMFGDPDEVLSGSAGWAPQVAAWLGGAVVADDVPVMSGHVTADASQAVPERLSLTVARTSTVNGRAFDWCPYDNVEHPLARFGQTLSVQIVVTSALNGAVWVVKIGQYRIQSWDEQPDGSIQVEAVGMLQRVASDRLTSPVAPSPSGSLGSEFRRLLPPGFSVSIDPALTDRACPQSFSWTDDRLAALYDIADAWPARLRTSVDGWRLMLLPPLPAVSVPVLTLTDVLRGVVTLAPAADTRDRAYNRVVARSTTTDATNSPTFQAVADQLTGPMSVTGNYGVETMFWSSPLVTTYDQALASARTLLADNLRPSRKLQVSMAPDPRIGLDSALEVLWRDRISTGWVLAYDLPLTVGDGPERITLGVSA
jgi:hypothetical protein